MRRLFSILLLLASSPPALSQEPGAGVRNFSSAVNGGDPEACLSAFAPGARVIDLGRDLSSPDRLTWFCNALVDAAARYEIRSLTIADGSLDWRFTYEAGSYRLNGRGTAKESAGRLTELIIVADEREP